MARSRLRPAPVALVLALVALLAGVSVVLYRRQRDLTARLIDTAAVCEAPARVEPAWARASEAKRLA